MTGSIYASHRVTQPN